MDTYTEALGSDDDEYERSQLVKIGGNVPVTVPPDSDADEPTSGAMKGPKKSHALPLLLLLLFLPLRLLR